MRAWTLALAVALAAGACGDDPVPEAPAEATAAATPGAYESLEEIAAAFDCVDVHDVGTGGNPGLSAFGICRIGRHNIDVYMTTDRGQWEHIAEEYPAVLGPNWIVVCPTGAAAARIVHERLGGELRIPPRSARGG